MPVETVAEIVGPGTGFVVGALLAVVEIVDTAVAAWLAVETVEVVVAEACSETEVAVEEGLWLAKVGIEGIVRVKAVGLESAGMAVVSAELKVA